MKSAKWLAVLLIPLAGCASQATHLSGDLAAADNLCQQHAYKTMVDRAQCLDANERPIIARDLPNVLYSYDAFQSARLAATNHYDRKVVAETKDAIITLDVRTDIDTAWLKTAVSKLSISIGQADAQDIGKAAIAACKKDGVYLSLSQAANFRCERDARIPIIDKRIPALSSVARTFWAAQIDAGATYDQTVQPIIRQALAGFSQEIKPAHDLYRGNVSAALEADAAATAQQQQESANLLGLALVGFASGYTAPAVAAPVFTSCTRLGNVVNCISQ